MRRLLLFLSGFWVVLSCPSFGQVLDGNPEHVVYVMLDPKSDGLIGGVMIKQLSRMGDAACVALTKLLAGTDPGPREVDRAVLVIETAFRDPLLVNKKEDRKPRTALFVLNSLAWYSKTPEQKKQIADTAAYVRQQYDRLPESERPPPNQ